MSDSYVTSQATIKCSCGDKCAKLTVYPDRTAELTTKPTANISDHVSMYNIAPFGKCHTTVYPPTGSATAANHGHLTPMPCVPGTVTEWINGKNDYLVKGKPALLKSSYCRCQWGGVITITNDGQVNTGDADLSHESIETEEEWNARQEEQLTPEQLLDGLQLVLDAAGLFPGLGAIPDLLNAAIYALRGDKANAALSLLAAVPGIGDAATATKLITKSAKAAKTTAKTAKAIEKTTSTTDMTTVIGENVKKFSEARELSGKELAEHRARQMGIDTKGGGSGILHDTVPDTPTKLKFLELTKKKPESALSASKSENGFSDLTKGDQWDIQKELTWDNVKKSQEQSSWNPLTVRDAPNIPKTKIDTSITKSNHIPSPEDVLKDNKMNKYGDYKPKSEYK